MTDSRDNILTKIKRNRPAPRPRREIPRFDIPGSAISNFVAHLKGFDGGYALLSSREEAINWLRHNMPVDGKKIASAVSEYEGTVNLSDYSSPAAMHEIDICVAEAGMAVGETGSLLVDNESLGNPAAALFSTDLYLLVDRNKMVAGMQDAYAAINLGEMQYSSFFSGPSATADIEAVHITGAQGEISLTALIYNCTPEDIEEVKKIMKVLPDGTPLGQPSARELKLRRPTDLETASDSV